MDGAAKKGERIDPSSLVHAVICGDGGDGGGDGGRWEEERNKEVKKEKDQKVQKQPPAGLNIPTPTPPINAPAFDSTLNFNFSVSFSLNSFHATPPASLHALDPGYGQGL